MRNVDHSLLKKAKKGKNDEFYTQLKDIESELSHYTGAFQGKVVYCNTDRPLQSNFVRFFYENFAELGLERLIATSYAQNGEGCGEIFTYDGDAKKLSFENVDKLEGDGDFRSAECLKILESADIVVTNPPFSLFREFVGYLTAYEKQFLIIGNVNAITYKEIFPLIKAEKVWLGVHLGRGVSGFIVPDEYKLYGTEARIDEHGKRIVSPNNCLWLTNVDYERRHEDLPLERTYEGNEDDYPRYDNFNGINVNKTKDIPSDYNGYMGVPITFLHKHNPEQFEIIKFRKGDDGKDLSVNGKCPYFRIIIRRKGVEPEESVVELGQTQLW